ncbi:MAG: dihydropteroate synthase [Candidatus Peregrinibacteria bacterium]|nr:dihydropteroate synthase [Candidatus Peregrinibacteria bacterium]
MKKTHSRKGPLIMGILNITPDSFSDRGKFMTLKEAVKQAKKMIEEEADILDIGGESTGPNSRFVTEKEELSRVIPVIKAIREFSDIPISIDTYKANVALEAIQNGADMVNDVTAMREDPKMAEVVKKHRCPIIMMYSKDNSPRTTIKEKKYPNVMQTIKKFFEERIAYAKSKGIKRDQIIIDPGMGQFISKIPHYSFEIIAKLQELEIFKKPILVGISRKSFLQEDLSLREEKAKTLSAIAYINGANIIRTHDVGGLRNYLNLICQ